MLPHLIPIFFPEGINYDMALSGGDVGKNGHHSHIAVLAAGEPCKVYLSEKE